MRDGPVGPGVTCPQANPSTSLRRGPTWYRSAGNVMPSPVAPRYVPVTGNRNSRKQKEPDKFERDKVEWARWATLLQGGMIGPILKRDLSLLLAFGAKLSKSSVVFWSHKEVTMRQ